MRHPAPHVLVSLLVAVPGVVGLGQVTAPAAEGATAMCSVRVPGRVMVNAPEVRIEARLAPDCESAGTTYASWNVVHRTYGNQNVLIFTDGRHTDVWKFQDWQYKGRFTVVPSTAYDSSYTRVAQNRPRVEVRYAARVSLTARRAGEVVTLRAHATRYTSATSGFTAIRGRRAFFSARDCGRCAWHRIGAVVTGRYGKATLRVRTARARDYRAVMRGTASVWGRTSAVSRR